MSSIRGLLQCLKFGLCSSVKIGRHVFNRDTTFGGPDSVPIRVEQHVGRNDRCPCGSGRKYKRCCGRGS